MPRRHVLSLILAGAGLTASDPVAGELRAAATGAGNPVDRGPADALVVANPGFAIGSDAGEKHQLTVSAVGLHPMALSNHFETSQIDCVSSGVHAVGVAIRIHAGQQVGAAGASGQARDLCHRVGCHQQGKHEQCSFQGVVHGLYRVGSGVQDPVLCPAGQEGWFICVVTV